jgi:hypothetical protein
MPKPEHPLVTEFLLDFDHAAAGIPAERRRVLRAEIASHLRDQVAPDAMDEEAKVAILEFGTPSEIVVHELGAEPPTRRPRLMLIGGAASALVVASVVAGILVFVHPSTSEKKPPSPFNSVVSAHPEGSDRVIEGTAFAEYVGAAGELPPLPPTAEWPVGVPTQLDGGLVPDASGVLEAGAGRWVARFTWLCAWEGEYLAAEKVHDRSRISAAYDSLDYWAGLPFQAETDPAGGWRTNVVDPLKADDATGLKADFPNTCMQAGIVDVANT